MALVPIAIAAAQHHQFTAPLPELVLLPFFALVIVSAALADIEGRPGLLRLRPFEYAGEVSYVFYIIQFPLLAEIYRWRHSGWQAITASFVVVSLASVVGHHLIERPFQRLLSPRRLVA
jgi:peptidoglycan/LPS O-acetylase OafA/YrhL